MKKTPRILELSRPLRDGFVLYGGIQTLQGFLICVFLMAFFLILPMAASFARELGISSSEAEKALRIINHIPAPLKMTDDMMISLLLNKIEKIYREKNENILLECYAKDYKGLDEKDVDRLIKDTGEFFKSVTQEVVLTFISHEAYFQQDKASMEAIYTISYSKDTKKGKNYIFSDSIRMDLRKFDGAWRIVKSDKYKLWE